MTLKKLTGKMEKDYIKAGGTKCLYCKSPRVSAEPLDADGDVAWSNAKCEACGREWTDRFELSGVSEVSLEPCDIEALEKFQKKD